MSHAVVTPAEMSAAEQRVFAAGTPSFDVMTLAGESVAAHLHEVFPAGHVRVLCGPGGNGGDGFIAASWLRERGRDVTVYLLGEPEKLKGDSARAFGRWQGPVQSLESAIERSADITLDALFGGGLSRPLNGAAAQLAQTGGRIVSVDVPSGIDGRTARPIGPAFTADLTVTFAAFRPAHVLSPGRSMCGQVVVQDIGVPVSQQVQVNHEAIWAGAGFTERAGFVLADLLIYEDAGFREAFASIMDAAANAIEAASQAAQARNRVVVVLRETERLVASPDGRCVIDISEQGQQVQEAGFHEKVRQAMENGLPLFESVCRALAQAAA